MRISALLALSLAGASGSLWAQCIPTPAVQTALDGLPVQTLAQTSWEFRQHYNDAVQALRSRFPGDLFVERAYVQSMGREADKDKVIAEYKARHEKSPDDPTVSYLYATALQGRQTAESIKLFEAALTKAPQFPWPHMGLASIYGMPVFQNKEDRVKHLKAFLTACPDSLAGYQTLANLDDKDLLGASATKLRALLEPRTDKEAIRGYRTLWSIEFKAHPPSEYDGLRKQVAKDLAAIRALNREDDRQWYYTLEQGYKLANDVKQAEWASDERQRRSPEYYELASMSKWYKDHPNPNSDDSADKKRSYYAEVFKQSDRWVKERPKMADLWQTRLAAMEYLDVPASDVEAAADTCLKLASDDAGPDGPYSNTYFTVARVLSRKHLQPERVVELAQKGLAKVKVEDSAPMYDAYATKENLQDSKFYNSLDPVTGSTYEAAGFIELKDVAKARLTLTRMDDELAAVKAAVGDKADYRKEYTSRMAEWWGLMARAAELDGRNQDAMAFYEHALLARIEGQQLPETGLPDEVADNARRLWAKLGGSNEGWQLWYGRDADLLANKATLSWEETNMPLPAFELTDLKGKTWTQEALKGKTTFLNFWASW